MVELTYGVMDGDPTIMAIDREKRPLRAWVYIDGEWHNGARASEVGMNSGVLSKSDFERRFPNVGMPAGL